MSKLRVFNSGSGFKSHTRLHPPPRWLRRADRHHQINRNLDAAEALAKAAHPRLQSCGRFSMSELLPFSKWRLLCALLHVDAEVRNRYFLTPDN